MNKVLYGVYGASGYGREVMPIAENYIATKNEFIELVFIDDSEKEAKVNGHPVLTYQKFLEADATEKYVSIAIANSSVRDDLAQKINQDDIKPVSIEHSNVVKMFDVKIGEGAILSPFVTLTSNIIVGKQFHANIYSYVAHDCTIGDYVTLAPGVKCNGNVIIEDHVYVGTGAIIKQGKPNRPLIIGKGAIIGMGAVITKNVKPGETVIGNPAAPLSKLRKRSS